MNNVFLSGIKARGGKELRAHMDGKRLTSRQAILAKCYECAGGYSDGKTDCTIVDCALYPFMPYGKHGKKAQAARKGGA